MKGLAGDPVTESSADRFPGVDGPSAVAAITRSIVVERPGSGGMSGRSENPL
jgi:hypothetical protein